MLVIAVAGIKLTARPQVAMATTEYTILIGFALAGLIRVFGRHPGTVPVTRGWFSLNGVNGKGDLAAGLAASVYRHRILSNARDAILGAAAFLG